MKVNLMKINFSQRKINLKNKINAKSEFPAAIIMKRAKVSSARNVVSSISNELTLASTKKKTSINKSNNRFDSCKKTVEKFNFQHASSGLISRM